MLLFKQHWMEAAANSISPQKKFSSHHQMRMEGH